MSIRVPRFADVHIGVIGDVMLDRYWSGEVSRISPEAPVPVIRLESDTMRAGGAANVALNAYALGAEVSLFGLIADDDAGRALQTTFAKATEHKAHGCWVTQTVHPTISKLRLLGQHQTMLRVDQESAAFEPADAKRLAQAAIAALPKLDALIISDYNKGSLQSVPELIAAAKTAGVPVMVDPKGQDFTKYTGATVITPNQSEFETIVGACDDKAQLVERGQALREQLELEALLVTRSANGMMLVTADDVLHVRSEPKEVFDVTGAGDTAICALALSKAAGCSWADAVHLSVTSADIVVGKLGTASVNPRELRLALHRKGLGGRALLDLDRLQDYVAQAKAEGKKVVMTNGCFDILHAGHVAYLEEAKSMGDRLLVAVNSDDSIARLKGPQRPINQLKDRLAIMAGLAAVDWVIAFDQDTPLDLIETILPDVLVKGEDYAVEDIVGAKAVLAAGGEVKTIEFKEGYSTSGVIDTIVKTYAQPK